MSLGESASLNVLACHANIVPLVDKSEKGQ
jgi:hypothetical protein